MKCSILCYIYMVSYVLITGYSVLLFMNPLNFKFLQVPAVAVILEVLFVSLLAALNFANVFFKIINV